MTRVTLVLVLSLEFTSAMPSQASTTPSDTDPTATASGNFTLVTNVAQLRALSRADFNRGRPVSFMGIVTLVDRPGRRLVLQDTTGAMMWYWDRPLAAGLTGKLVRLICTNACVYSVTFPEYPDHPSGADIQPSFEAPSNWGDYHLQRMAADLHPPRSGEYTFWIASDDSSELWLSTDERPTRVRKIAFVMEGLWTDPHQWDHFPSQRSELIHLQSGRSYYIEAFQEQGLLNDHLSVAWEGPGMARSVISGAYLTPWGHEGNQTNGVLREYWTNYTAGSVTPVSPGGPAGTALAGRDARLQVLGEVTWPKPRKVDLSIPLWNENNYRWIQTEGTVTFASANGGGVNLELAAGSRRALVRVAKWNLGRLPRGQDWHAQVQGVCEGIADPYEALTVGFIWVPDSRYVRLFKPIHQRRESFDSSNSVTNLTPGFGGYYTERGVVTFDGRYFGRRYLYVQDLHGSVSVSDADRDFKQAFKVGQWVQVGGTLSSGKVGLQLVPQTMRLLGWQSLPLPVEAGGNPSYRDGQWTEIEGVVRSVGANGVWTVKGTGRRISVWSPVMRVDQSLVDCTVRVRGVMSLEAPDAPVLLVGSRDFVQVEKHRPKNPFAIPLIPIADLGHSPSDPRRAHRVKIEGTITYASDRTVFLQDYSGAVRLQLLKPTSLHPGDRVEVVGFPDGGGSTRVLTEPILRPAGLGAALKPVSLDLPNILTTDNYDRLVQVRGYFLSEQHRGPVHVLNLQSGQRTFEALLTSITDPLPTLAVGSLLKVTGICLVNVTAASTPKPTDFENPPATSLRILLRAPADITILRGPPWWTAGKLAALIGLLLIVLGGTLLWTHLLGRKYQRRQMAQLEFSRQVLKSQESERHRIAANLHDSLGQNLLVIKNQIRLAMQPALDTGAVFERLDKISGLTSQVIEEVRQITHDLRPYQLTCVGLSQTLRGTIHRVSENCRIALAGHVDDVDGLFDSDAEIHIYRILQEALNNVVKHSGATEAVAVIRRENDSVLIVVRDNGRGVRQVPPGTELSHAGFGLSGIEERARILHGNAAFDSRPDEGFRLRVEIPLPRHV